MDNPLERVLEITEFTPPDLSQFIWGATLFILGGFALYSLFLLYHWLRYGEGEGPILLGMVIYFVVSAVLIISLLSSATLLT